MQLHRNGEWLPGGAILAPLWRRAFAALIDVLLVLAGLATGGLGVFLGFRLWHRLSVIKTLTRKLRRFMSGPAFEPLITRLKRPAGQVDTLRIPSGLSLQMRTVLQAPALVLALDSRNKRSIGARTMGIRRVELRTGDSIGVRSALIQYAASQALRQVSARVSRTASTRAKARLDEINPQLRALQRQHADDHAALQDALMNLYHEHKVNPASSCGWSLLTMVVLQVLPIVVSPLRQSLPDRLAGIVVVVDRPPE